MDGMKDTLNFISGDTGNDRMSAYASDNRRPVEEVVLTK